MIEKVLNALSGEKNQEGYLAALRMFQSGQPLTEEGAEGLAALYAEYGKDSAHPELAKLYIAVDLLPGRTREDAAAFSALGLKEDDLNALFTAKETIAMLQQSDALDESAVNAAVEAAAGGSVSLPIAIFLARSLLNILAWRGDFAGFRAQAARLAEFLIEQGADTLAEYETFMEEARRKCGS